MPFLIQPVPIHPIRRIVSLDRNVTFELHPHEKEGGGNRETKNGGSCIASNQNVSILSGRSPVNAIFLVITVDAI